MHSLGSAHGVGGLLHSGFVGKDGHGAAGICNGKAHKLLGTVFTTLVRGAACHDAGNTKLLAWM
jgi:hypothetical protein